MPKGTRGTVVAINNLGDGWDLVTLAPAVTPVLGVEWDLPIRMPSGQGLRDWFTREEMEHFMQRVELA